MNRPPFPAVCRHAAAWALAALFGGVLFQELRGGEVNVWPFYVGQYSDNNTTNAESWMAAGPLFFLFPQPSEDVPGGRDLVGGIRPFYMSRRAPNGDLKEAHGLYPFFTYRSGLAGSRRWSFLSLINLSTSPAVGGNGAGSPSAVPYRALDVWPFYFSRRTGNESLDYQAFFPIAGEVKERFGQDRMAWVLFPLYGRFEKRGVTTMTTPWPFIKSVSGDGNSGFEVWPLFGGRQKPGVYRERFVLWPFYYHNQSGLEKPQPDEKLGILPFYARDSSEGYRSETWLWPFFGYVDRTAPYRYHARNYFWPLFVQGRGEGRTVNRWAPFYTRSVIKGVDKEWVLWPLWRRLSVREGEVDQTKTQFFYFLYNATEQRSVKNPSAASAFKAHLWPLASVWDNGAGRRQVQVLSPLEVFLPQNRQTRIVWSPLFALYRYDHQPDGEVRHSFLWDGITYHGEPAKQASEFNIGPLYSDTRTAGSRRVSLLFGLFGFKRDSDRGWRPFVGEFNSARTRRAPATEP
ncbi:MAG: hypothetical protein KBA71_01715 [Opitutaceae bacterium]|nr:hypothetical protein [Opitutaceae bacterium]